MKVMPKRRLKSSKKNQKRLYKKRKAIAKTTSRLETENIILLTWLFINL